MSDNRPMVYEGPSGVVYRASSFGHCERALVAARLGEEPSAPSSFMQAIFDAGSAAEDWFVEKHDDFIHGTQDEVTLEFVVGDEQIAIRGHIDGYLQNQGIGKRSNVMEIKSQSSKLFDSWTHDSWTDDALWQKYAWQVSVYMIATGKELDLVRVRRPDGDEPYESWIHHYEKPFHSLEEIIERARRIETIAETGLLPKCDTSLTFNCPYWQLHEQKELTDDVELDALSAMYNDASQREAQYKQAKANLKQLIVERLAGRVDVSTFGGWNVKFTEFDVKEKVIPAGHQARLTVKERKQ